MLTQVGADAKTLSYAVVEMVDKGKVANKEVKSIKDIKKGLFEGILVHLFDDHSTRCYIVLSVDGKTTVMVDLDYYNILSIELYDGVIREYLFTRNTDKDQAKAFNELTDILDGLREAGRTVKGHDIVDLSTYTDLPSNFSTPSVGSTSNVNRNKPTIAANVADSQVNNIPKTGVGSTAAADRRTASYTHQAAANNTAVKKPTFQKRKTKIPHWTVLERLRKKITALADGAIEPDELPALDESPDVYVAGTVASHNSVYRGTNYWGG